MKKPKANKPASKLKQLDLKTLARVIGGGLSGPDEPGIITEIIPITTQEC